MPNRMHERVNQLNKKYVFLIDDFSTVAVRKSH